MEPPPVPRDATPRPAVGLPPRTRSLSDPANPTVGTAPGAVLAEQTDEWAEQRRYMGVEILAKARQAAAPATPQEVVPTTALSA
jgi:hypothetical protein